MRTLNDAHERHQSGRREVLWRPLPKTNPTEKESDRETDSNGDGDDGLSPNEAVEIPGGRVEDNIAETKWERYECEEEDKDDEARAERQVLEPGEHESEIASTKSNEDEWYEAEEDDGRSEPSTTETTAAEGSPATGRDGETTGLFSTLSSRRRGIGRWILCQRPSAVYVVQRP